jgi:methylthioribose-1-phosphate isomerase
VLVGADRVARNGDVCNKVGTSLVALAAHDAGVPFYAAVPSSSVDADAPDGAAITIEHRADDELTVVRGREADGRAAAVRVAPAGTRVLNPAFDVTPAALVTGLISERGIVPASPDGLRALLPEGVA